MKRLLLAAMLFGCVTSALAETTAIVGATVHTIGAKGTLESATVLIRDGRIAAVGSDVRVPDDAEVINAIGKVVTPGLFTPRGYLGLVEVGFSAGPLDAVQRGDQFTASFDVADAFNPQSTLIPVNRVEGVTRALVEPRPGFADDSGFTSSVISGLAAVVNLSGEPDSVDRRAAALVVTLGEAGVGYAGTSRVSPWLLLKQALSEAADYREHRDAHERGQHRDYTLSLADLDALQGVLSGDVPLFVNVDRASDILALVRLVEERELRAIISGGVEAWMHADALAAADIPVILAPASNLPSDFDRLNARGDAATILVDAGVRVMFADSQSHTHNARNITQSAGNSTVAGLTRDEALRAITLTPAEVYGVADSVGSLDVGKDADVVIWPGDPLELTVYPERVFIKGASMPMSSRQTLLFERYRDVTSETPPAYRR